MSKTIPLIYDGVTYEVEYEVEEARDFQSVTILDLRADAPADPNDIPDHIVQELPDLVSLALELDESDIRI